MSEHDEQVALFQWAKMREEQIPELKLLHAIPNGGHRHKAVAAKMQAEGVKPGVPDIFLPVPRNGYHGMYLEMKWGENKLTDRQTEWFDALHKQDYFCAVSWTWVMAKSLILRYLGLDVLEWE